MVRSQRRYRVLIGNFPSQTLNGYRWRSTYVEGRRRKSPGERLAWHIGHCLVQTIGYRAIKAGYTVLYRSVFDGVRDFLHEETQSVEDKVLAKYLKPEPLIIDDMGRKQSPKHSGAYLFEIVMGATRPGRR